MKKTVFSLFVAMAVLCGTAKGQSLFFEDFNATAAGALPEGWIAYGFDTLENHPGYANYNRSWQVWYPDGNPKNGEAMSVTVTTDLSKRCNRWLITPAIEIPAGSDYSLLFKHHDAVYGTLDVMISTTGTDTADFTFVGQAIMQPYMQTFHSLLSEYAGSTIRIAFVNRISHGNCAQYAAIDDVDIRALPVNDIDLISVDMPSEIHLGDTLKAKLTVMPAGNHRVDSYDYSYTYGTQAPVERTYTTRPGHTLWPYWTYDITVAIVPDAMGTVDITFHVDNPNGETDPTPNNNTIIRRLTVTAPGVGIDQVEANQVKVSTARGMLTVDGCHGRRVEVYNTEGRLVTFREGVQASTVFSLPSSGLYLVKVGALPAKKVAVVK